MISPTLTTADGLTLTGRRWLADGAPRAAVVVVHGFSASSECPNVEALANALHADDLDVITYDARGHGTSEGESTLGDHEQHDVAAAVGLARERTDRVVLVGASMGAIATLRYAVTDQELAGAVTVSCPAEWKLPRNGYGVLAAAMTRTGLGRRAIRKLSGVRVYPRWTNPTAPVQLVPLLKVPLTIIHGTDDRFIPARAAAQLAEVAPEPRRVVIMRGMGHAFESVAIDPIRDAVSWALRYQLTAAY
jgi:alpha-beta hydrolase superfamily lysophospholipase